MELIAGCKKHHIKLSGGTGPIRLASSTAPTFCNLRNALLASERVGKLEWKYVVKGVIRESGHEYLLIPNLVSVWQDMKGRERIVPLGASHVAY